MKKSTKFQVLVFLILFLAACKTPQSTTTGSNYGKKDGKVEWIFLQLNDVYEIAPIENGKYGGLARVATLRKKLLAENPNTYTVLAGDFLNPSLTGTLKYEGKSIKGRHMIEALNALDLDFVTFGNHEFDLEYPDLQARIDESNFVWIAANAFKAEGNGEDVGIVPFSRTKDPEHTHFPEYYVINVSDGDSGERCNVGMWSVVLDVNKREYVQFSDIFERSKTLISEVMPAESDCIVGLTHLSIENDKEIAQNNPSVSLIMGGHEHNNMIHKVGNTVITKADANAKTAYIHRCSYDIKTKKTTIKSELVTIDKNIVEDPEVAIVVKKWTDIAKNAFASAGFDTEDVVADLKTPLDGRSATTRIQQTNLGLQLAESMAQVAKTPVDCAFFNSGSIRLDDFLAGQITQVDILRCLPFGGVMVEMDITGAELRKVLTAGNINKMSGGYLQWYKIDYNADTKKFGINGKEIEDTKIYHVISTEFLLSGREKNLDFFVESNPNISNITRPNAADKTDLRLDVRKAFIQYLKNKN